LNKDSPAFRLGFHAIDFTAVGPRPVGSRTVP
jgi:hypothetical protein